MVVPARRSRPRSLLEATLLGVAALSAVACGRAAASSSTDKTSSTEALVVETVPAEVRAMPRVIRLTGSVVGLRQTDLAANASGKVLDAPIDRGAQVKKGDILARLDVRSASLGAEEARASLAALDARQRYASAECERSKALFEGGAISKAEYDHAKLQCEISPADRRASEARASLAALNVTDGTVRAPFDGYVTDRHIHEGDYVRTDTPVISLVDLDTLRLEVAVPEVYLGALRPGAQIRFTVPAFEGREFTAKLRATSGKVRPATRDVIADAEVPNGDHALLPGMFASVALPLAVTDSVAIPDTAIFQKNAGAHVFVFSGDRLDERVVDVGGSTDGFVAIDRGLRVGEAVVGAPTAEMKNGQAARRP